VVIILIPKFQYYLESMVREGKGETGKTESPLLSVLTSEWYEYAYVCFLLDKNKDGSFQHSVTIDHSITIVMADATENHQGGRRV
jgi:hypothetical protein